MCFIKIEDHLIEHLFDSIDMGFKRRVQEILVNLLESRRGVKMIS